jgi:hypothetical protein
MVFNAATKKIECVLDDAPGTGEVGEFGFEKGTREDIWMQNTARRLRDQFGVSPQASKEEKKAVEAKIAGTLNRAYDFMFWIDERDVDFWPVTQPKETVYVRIQKNDSEDTQILSGVITCYRFPVDDVMRRIELNPKEVVALGPMEPLDFDSKTGEATSWQLLAAPIRVSQAEINAEWLREEQYEQQRKPANFVQSENVLDGVSIVTESEWIRTHKEQFRQIQQESMMTTVRNLSTMPHQL